MPARINLLGTHIEHRGGFVNYLSIDRELWCIGTGRRDGLVRAADINPRYGNCEFDISRELPERGVPWTDYIRKVSPVRGDWANYVRAAVLYLQNTFPETSLKGMDLSFSGGIPVGAGLSSSSALVVASMLMACRVNRLDPPRERLPEMCGEAEWYVGTRGGSGDHAAMIFGRKDAICHLQFFPFRVEYVPFPVGYDVLCCHSCVEAKKSEHARSIFNDRIASYAAGLSLLRKNFPAVRDRLRYLRDVNRRVVGSDAEVYRMLRSLPETASRGDLKKTLPSEGLDILFETHDEPSGGYRIRDVVMYGVAECDRAERCADSLREGRVDEFGRLMFCSHDGDRVMSFLPEGTGIPWTWRLSNDRADRLQRDSESPDAAVREAASVYNQPGGYACSTPELDFIVDLASRLPGVKGAKLTGAGLGGCVLVLVERAFSEEVLETIGKQYYDARNLPRSSAFVCRSSDGAGFAE